MTISSAIDLTIKNRHTLRRWDCPAPIPHGRCTTMSLPVRTIMRSNKRSEAGFGILLELLVAMAISTILLAGSTVAIFRVQAAQNEIAAQQRLRQVAQAQAALAICAQTSGCVPSVGLAAIIPPDGSSIAQSGYLFQYSNNSGLWFMTAAPVSQSFSGQATYRIDYTGILRCMPDNDPPAGPSSPTC